MSDKEINNAEPLSLEQRLENLKQQLQTQTQMRDRHSEAANQAQTTVLQITANIQLVQELIQPQT
jgi:hypothetical protein